MIRALILAGALFAADPAHADVVGTDATGFTVAHSVTLAGVSKQAAYQRLLSLPRWWDPAHTYSGKGESLTFKARPGGCWCEKLEDGGFVEHARVILARPGAQLRLAANLGPVQGAGAGVLTFDIADSPQGAVVKATYLVHGFGPQLQPLAAPVDFVLGQAMARYRDYAP